ncbi:MAG: divalent-cation tolerance protein CutA [Blastocatellia bacterium]|nr:divalent-cation tolerance protein CutA [Blastocatellia bacterium]
MQENLIVFVTVDNQESAQKIASNLVEERLAACVNIVSNVESVYRWEGKLCQDKELLLIIKTSKSHYEKLEARILNLHSYTTPEIIALPIVKGSTAYLAWLNSSLE